MERQAPHEDYNLSFGKNKATSDLVYSMCTWIEHVADQYKEWWLYDNNQNFHDKNVHAKFNGRMARIVYALFKNEVIWNVFDNYLTEFMRKKIDNFRLYTPYERTQTSKKRDVFEPKSFMKDQVDKFIKKFENCDGNAHARIRPRRHLRTPTVLWGPRSTPTGTTAASQTTATKGTPPAPTGSGSKASTHRPQANLPLRRTSVPRSPNPSKQVGVLVSCAASQQTRA
jgi:hypothetical protein